MKNRYADNHILVIADDFTGANDAGMVLAQQGSVVDVLLHAHDKSESVAEVRILNSDSRALPSLEAYERISSMMVSALEKHRPDWVIKKIDSTLRGNPGMETQAMMHVADIGITLVAPALPAAGRIVRDGKCLVNGKELTETEFASDPKTPVCSADVREIFQSQSDIPCWHISLETLRSGALADKIADISAPAMIIIDSETDADLDRVINTALRLKSKPLLVGSAGLCDALARTLLSSKQRCLLAVIGSMSEMAQKQIHYLQQNTDTCNVFIDINDALQGHAEHYRLAIINALNNKKHCLVHTCPDNSARHQIDDLCQKWKLSRSELGERISAFLGELSRDVLRLTEPDALYLSGGDVAVAVSRALGATGFRIRGAATPCVPWGYFLGGNWQKPVMTKAGGFGDETTLFKVMNFIEENISV